jgi:hypothetical protein
VERSWNERRFLAADRQKWKEFLDNLWLLIGKMDSIIIITIIIIIICTYIHNSKQTISYSRKFK